MLGATLVGCSSGTATLLRKHHLMVRHYPFLLSLLLQVSKVELEVARTQQQTVYWVDEQNYFTRKSDAVSACSHLKSPG